MKVTIITTVRHNVGDDFIREGVMHVLEHALGENLDYQLIHKHTPVSARPGFEFIRKYRISKAVDSVLPDLPALDKVLGCDLLVQSGAPVFWTHPQGPHCADNEWFGPLIERRYRRVASRVPFFNLAAGSAQEYRSDGSEILAPFARVDREYIQRLMSLTDVVTLRDRVAQNMLHLLGWHADVIPCSSIFSAQQLGIMPAQGEYVALNFMDGGSHFDFSGDISKARWLTEFRKFYEVIKTREKTVFICHDDKEVRMARMVDEQANIFYSADYRDYLRMYAQCKYGVMNRIHGCFGLSSLGRPSFLIGSDSRTRMAREINLPFDYVNNVDAERLLDECGALEDRWQNYREEMDAIKARALSDYQRVIGYSWNGATS